MHIYDPNKRREPSFEERVDAGIENLKAAAVKTCDFFNQETVQFVATILTGAAIAGFGAYKYGENNRKLKEEEAKPIEQIVREKKVGRQSIWR